MFDKVILATIFLCTVTSHGSIKTWPYVSQNGSWCRCLGLDLARYPICILRMALVVPDYTLNRVHQIIAWSFQVAEKQQCSFGVSFFYTLPQNINR